MPHDHPRSVPPVVRGAPKQSPDELTAGAHRVTEAAVTAVAAALEAAADLASARWGTPPPRVHVDPADAVHAFGSERHLTVDGTAPVLWDPVAGEYAASDTWVRLHTNYPHHRTAALRALGLAADARRDQVAARVAGLSAAQVEEAVVDAGGAAARLRTVSEWAAHPQARAVRDRPLVGRQLLGQPGPALPVASPRAGSAGAASSRAGTSPAGTSPAGASRTGSARDAPAAGAGADPAPLAGLRVLDLTRVIAGPTAGKVLAALGARVLRIDPPGFPEVAPLVVDTTAGKSAAWLDLRGPDGDATMARLVAGADVLLTGLRPGALDGAGWPVQRLLDVRPGLVVGRLSAYGDTGPWAGRRGFDSLVQLVTGLAGTETLAAGRSLHDTLVPLPLQALDHASGWLLAAGVVRALVPRAEGPSVGAVVDVVLARTAQWLAELGPVAARGPLGSPRTEEVSSLFGTVRRVRAPGSLGGRRLEWAGAPMPLGSSPPAW